MAITKVTRALLSTGIVDNSNATAITIDSSENVGIGTGSPSYKLHVNGVSRFDNHIEFGGSISTPSTAAAIYRPADNTLAFSTANTERMRIDSSGIVGIGNTVAGTIHGVSTVSNLVVGTGSGNNGIGVYSGSSNLGALTFADGTSGNTTYRGGVTYNHSTDHLELNVNGGSAHVIVHSSGVTSIPYGVELGSGVDATAANTLDDYEEGTWTPACGATLSVATGHYTKIGNQVTVHYRVVSTGGLPSSGGQVQISGLPFTIDSNGAGSIYARYYTLNDSTLTTVLNDGDNVIRLININEQSFDYTLWGELEASSNNSVDIRGTATYKV